MNNFIEQLKEKNLAREAFKKASERTQKAYIPKHVLLANSRILQDKIVGALLEKDRWGDPEKRKSAERFLSELGIDSADYKLKSCNSLRNMPGITDEFKKAVHEKIRLSAELSRIYKDMIACNYTIVNETPRDNRSELFRVKGFNAILRGIK